MKKKPDSLQTTIETTLAQLLNPHCGLTAEAKDEKRKDLLLAIKWQSVKLKMDTGEWGAGFGDKVDETEETDDDE